ncbi:MAG: hypothetical protein AB1657_04175 [Candidatus Micrarchaeota archaeon]
MAHLTGLEGILHLTLFAIAIATPLILFYIVSRMRKHVFRDIIMIYAFAFLFSAFRWAGGSMTAMGYEFTGTLLFQWAWFLTGLLAAVLGIAATIKMYYWLKENAFEAVK